MFESTPEKRGDVAKERQEDVHALGDGFGIAREVDDERPATGDGDASRKDRERRLLQPFHPEGHGDAGYIALGDVARGLWGDVARRQARAASGDDDVGQIGVRPGSERLGDSLTSIRDGDPANEEMPVI